MPKKTKLTPFGMELKKARIDADETQSALAKALKVSTAFISGIETGARKIPDEFVEQVINHYESIGVALPSNMGVLASVSNGKVDISKLTPEHKALTAKLASIKLTDEQCKKIALEFNV